MTERRIVKVDYVHLGILDLEIEAAFQCAASQVMVGQVVDCCYMVSDALVRVLHELGYTDARCVSADVYGWNGDADTVMREPQLARDLMRMQDAAERGESFGMGFKRRARLNRLDPYTFNLHHEQNAGPDGYDGHVMVEVAGHILCPTFGQFNREDQGIKVHHFAIIPVEQFRKMPKNMRTFNPNITKKSMRPRKLAMTGSRERGYVVICLRPDIEDGAWLDKTPETRGNIEAYADDLLVDSRNLIQQLRDSGLK